MKRFTSIHNLLSAYIRRFGEGGNRQLWYLLMVVSVLGMMDIPGSRLLTSPLCIQWICIVLIAFLKATVFVVLLRLCRRWRFASIMAWLLTALHVLLCVVNFVSFEFYGFGISHKLMVVVLQTNGDETKEFLPGLWNNLSAAVFTTGFWCWTAGIIAGDLLMVRMRPKLSAGVILAGSVAGVVALVSYMAGLHNGRNSFFLTVRTVKNIVEVRREQREIALLLAKINDNDRDYVASSTYKAHTVVMIVGESASRGRLSLYGYPLPTSPRLEAMRDSLFVYTEAIGSSVTTSGNMARILTLKKDDTVDGDWWNYPLLIDIFKGAGYKTYWLSNQERTGIWSNSSGVIAGRADVVNYVGVESSEDALLQKYDEALLPEVRKALADGDRARFIGVHMYGSHTAYKKRYPGERRYFTGKDVERAMPRAWMTPEKYEVDATYSNSIRYSDSIVSCIFRDVALLKEPAVAIYFSDHGECVYDYSDFRGRDERFVEVPYVVYANEAYRRENPEMMEALRESVGKRISTANVGYTLMTLTGTEYNGYDGEDDVLSPQFKERRRYVDEVIWKYDRER